jgi:hypothetical protein
MAADLSQLVQLVQAAALLDLIKFYSVWCYVAG